MQIRLQWYACGTEIDLREDRGYVKRMDAYCAGGAHLRQVATIPNDGGPMEFEWLRPERCDGTCGIWLSKNHGLCPPIALTPTELFAQH